jgi:hypothetical protein
MPLVNLSSFARIAGVHRSYISRLVQQGKLLRMPSGEMDTESPVNKAFIDKQRKEGKKSRPNLISSKEVAAANPSKPPQSRRVIQEEQEEPENLNNGKFDNILLDSILSGETVIDALENLSKESTDRLRTIEQIKKLRIETEVSRNKLIPRELVSRIFSKIYAIDINEFKTLGPAISQDIIPLVGIVKEDQVMAIGEMVDKHLRKVLQHIKRIIDDFLKTLEVEMKSSPKK